MKLPDHSGLAVLDQLKRDSRTRHIPVHVASVADFSQEALELGAIGYALKPVKREELVEAFEAARSEVLAERATRAGRRRRSASALERRTAAGAMTTCASPARPTAAEALKQLRANTFDCMVLDLTLPDVSGYELLEKMANRG